MKLTVLVPAFKPAFIGELLMSFRNQTVRPGRIVFSDDSPNGAYAEALMSDLHRPLREGLAIECQRGPRQGASRNVESLLALWNGSSELVHIMLDDDVLYPEFYERHLLAHASGDFSCSISRRWTANEVGLPLRSLAVPVPVTQTPHRMVSLSPDFLFLAAIAPCHNWLGEMSNAVFRSDCRDILQDKRFGEVSYRGLDDLGAFVCASMRRPVAYILDHLGYFRTGGQQNTSDAAGPYLKAAHIGWVALAVGARRIGRLSASQAQQACATMEQHLARSYGHFEDTAALCAEVPRLRAGEPDAEDRFIAAWHAFLDSHRI